MTLKLAPRSLNTYIFMIDEGSVAIKDVTVEEQGRSSEQGEKTYYDLHGRPLAEPKGLCIEQSADGTARKVFF